MLSDEVSTMSKSQQARASVLARLHYELTHLGFAEQVKVTEELLMDLALCLQQARSRKVELLASTGRAKLLTVGKKP